MKARGKRFFLFYWIFLFYNFSIFAQQMAGEKVPDLKFNNLVNSKTTSIRLSDFKGKLIILDFWSFRCSNCIEEFSKLEALQNKFSGKIQILLVNHEGQKKTIEFFEKNRKMFRRPDLIFITGDTILWKMFPKNYVPWEIWIDAEQRFRFATDGSDVTEERITSFISKGEFLGAKLTPHPDFKKYTALFEQTNKEYLKSIHFLYIKIRRWIKYRW